MPYRDDESRCDGRRDRCPSRKGASRGAGAWSGVRTCMRAHGWVRRARAADACWRASTGGTRPSRDQHRRSPQRSFWTWGDPVGPARWLRRLQTTLGDGRRAAREAREQQRWRAAARASDTTNTHNEVDTTDQGVHMSTCNARASRMSAVRSEMMMLERSYVRCTLLRHRLSNASYRNERCTQDSGTDWPTVHVDQ